MAPVGGSSSLWDLDVRSEAVDGPEVSRDGTEDQGGMYWGVVMG